MQRINISKKTVTQRKILLPRRQLHALEEEEEDELHGVLKKGDHQRDEGE